MQDKRKRYYLLGGIPFLVSLINLLLFGVRDVNIAFFSLGYCWNFALLTPGLSRKINKRRYRFSFIKLIYKLHLILLRLFYMRRWIIIKVTIRVIVPTLSICTLWFFFRVGNPVFSFMGALFFEFIVWGATIVLKRNLQGN